MRMNESSLFAPPNSHDYGYSDHHYCRSAKKWRVQACQRGAFVRLIGPNVDPPVWDCPAFGATTIM